MKQLKLVTLVMAAVLALLVVGQMPRVRGADASPSEKANALMQQGNWKEAYDAFSTLALDPKAPSTELGNYLQRGVSCLNELNRQEDIDAFLEKVVAAHPDDWRALAAVAQQYQSADHYGYIVGGKFYRGYHRGGGRYVSSYARDRVRALQLFVQAMPLADRDTTSAGGVGGVPIHLAETLQTEMWRMQELTDLTTLPDYDENYRNNGGWRGAPVHADGTPVFFGLPKSWEAAQNDGERWHWALEHAKVVEKGVNADQADYIFASFLQGNFDVQTMAEFGHYFASDPEDDTRTDDSGPYAVQTLSDEETIARLANGIKRFPLPKEFNFIHILQRLADGKGAYARDARNSLARMYENRRQYSRAVTYWKLLDQPEHIKQIIGYWGQFEPVGTQPAGQTPTVEYRFRNGKTVTFNARKINVDQLLTDVQAYIKQRPNNLNWDQLDISNLGYRLVTQNQQKYLGGSAAKWTQRLEPRANHFDKRITITAPLKQAGAYLLTATMDGGNTSNVVLWVADLAIVKKPLDQGTLYYVADAVTGKPEAKANLEFFGYKTRWVDDRPNRGGHNEIDITNFAEYTGKDGQLVLKATQQPEGFNWIITARAHGRLAYLGFTNVWYGRRYDEQYNQAKTFVMTDRPVYRPGQPVKFKFWVNRAKYDQEGQSEFAGKSFAVRAINPRNEKMYDATLTADNYGGFSGEFTLPKEATLGTYQLCLPNAPYGGGTFRVEEYKKPEFEVTVDAPKAPVMLGEKINATIQAKYYFGAPVTEAKVKYKVMRTAFTSQWYPQGTWDWFYGPGYWWFGYDCDWYPGWRDWGCRRPIPIWWGWRPQPQPEVVAEAEVAVGADGTVKVEIDTALAKAMQADMDHRYEITAEVTDQSRRTIVGQGTVLVARKPFKVYAWVNRGHYRVGDVVHSYFSAQTLDNKPVQGKGELRLLKIRYQKDGRDLKPVETEVQRWALDTNEEGRAYQQMKASEAGQYRLSYQVTDAAGHVIEGAYLFNVIGQGVNTDNYRFNELELIPDQREYHPGDTVKLMVNTNRADATVLLFVRPSNGIYLPPKVLHLDGKSTVEEIAVTKQDMPNFFVEAVTVYNGKVYSEVREIVVPPEKRVLTVTVTPSAAEYQPGEKATLKVKLTDAYGKPYQGSTVLSLYDKSVEYISGGSNVPEIKDFFWKWRRSHSPNNESSLDKGSGNFPNRNQREMENLGIFGGTVADEEMDGTAHVVKAMPTTPMPRMQFAAKAHAVMPGAPGVAGDMLMANESTVAFGVAGKMDDAQSEAGAAGQGGSVVQPTVRSNFADTALWVAALSTDANGEATVDVTMPENLTTWKTRVWAMGDGTAVGQGDAEVVTTKNLIVRLQAPRFFTQKDEVVISANVHNYLKTAKRVTVTLEVPYNLLEPLAAYNSKDGMATLANTVEVKANGETRVDWRVKAIQPGEATVRVKALTDEESDAMQLSFPVYVHGMLKMDSFSGVIRPEQSKGVVTMTVPAERKPEQSRLEVRYSPTLAGAMVDALPYLTEYPYGCTEQTLNRFLPTIITQHVLLRMGLNLEDIQRKRTNLNAQEIGDDQQRAQDWKRMEQDWRGERTPVFDQAAALDMAKAGIERLASMQCSDGGWGWFSGYGEQSYPHTTALVVHGLQLARANDIALTPNMLERGVEWLKQYQTEQVRRLKLKLGDPEYKEKADAIDAFIYMVLADESIDNKEMREFLYRDRNDLPVYAKSMFGLALHRVKDYEKRDMLIRNIDQYLVQDDENQTAYLRLPENNWWWCWYGSEYEAQAYYLKLLCVTDPKGEKASRLVKYLINNRKNATYWNSTRDTAIVIEAFADYLKASGEDSPNMTVDVRVDGKTVKSVKIDKSNLFSFDNKFVLEGAAVTSGAHTVELVRTGTGPLYYNAYLSYFTLEDHISKTGLEVKVNRTIYKLVREDATALVEGTHGQAIRQQVEKYRREELKDLSTLKSGDLVEVELVIDSKNDYEYLLFEDMKAAGFEPVDVQSGYTYNDLGAYMELRDDRVSFFVRRLARGTHSLKYRLRAEVPGLFSALPTRASALYAPELKANSDEIKLRIED